MPKASARDHSIVYTVAIAAIVLAAGFAAAWAYQRHQQILNTQTVNSKPTRVVAGTADYSVAMSFAIKTSGDKAEWVGAHRQALEQVAKRVLISQDARRALRPGGLQALQQTLRDAGNAALHTDKLQQVIVTDFLVSSGTD